MPDLLDRLKAALADRYAIERELGSGGMATVYLAEDLKHHRPVAVKVLRPELAAALGPARFLREIEIAARLTHPHILPLHDSGEAQGFLYYVMPYVEGEPLRHRLTRDKQLPVEEAVQIAREVADALSYAHSCDVVHRDIKPENILFQAGHAVVADFGIARAITAAGGEKLTETGLAVGTPAYMSPEQSSGSGEVDGRSDIYSLGCVLYEMLAGQPPFTGPTIESVVRQHLTTDPKSVTDLRSTVPTELARALEKALAKTPADRFTTAGRFAEALSGALAGRPPPPTAPATRKRITRLITTFGVATLLAAGALGLWLRSSARTPTTPGTERPRLVVLPFENLGAPEDEYFADGITDEITARLAKVNGLAIIARQSAMRYKNDTKTPEQIGKELGVDYLLEATISWQRAADGSSRVRVRPQLIRVSDATHVWADIYDEDMTEVFRVQSTIAERVADALGIALLENERRSLAVRPTNNLEAYDRFLRGNYYVAQRRRDAVVRAIREYEAAARLDSAFTRALARIGYSYGLFLDWDWDFSGLSTEGVLARGFAAVDQALRVNPRTADAWMARAYLLSFRHPRTFEGVADAFEQAIAFDPRNAEAYHQYGSAMSKLGDDARAVANLRRALAIEPARAITLVELGVVSLFQHRYSEALRWMDSALVVDPAFYHGYEHRAQVRSHLGQHAQARVDAESAMELTNGSSGQAVAALVAARAGDTAAARVYMKPLSDSGLMRDKPAAEERFWAIGAVVALGEVQHALELLAHEQLRGTRLWFMLRSPDFDAIRSHPRFQELVEESRPTEKP